MARHLRVREELDEVSCHVGPQRRVVPETGIIVVILRVYDDGGIRGGVGRKEREKNGEKNPKK